MGESLVQVATGGTGPKLHTWQTTIGANNVEDEFVLAGPYPYPTYSLAVSASGATANDHGLCVNASASLKVRVHYIRIRQGANGAAVAPYTFNVLRTTTGAPTGGTALTPAPFDTADTAGAAGRSLPAVKGTESTVLLIPVLLMRQALLATAAQADDVYEWRAGGSGGHGKPIIIPAGTTNGLVIKNNSASAGVTWSYYLEFTETAF